MKERVYSDGVELVSFRESYIRSKLATSTYSHLFTVDELIGDCERHGVKPDELPEIVDELNKRRAQMDVGARVAWHCLHADDARRASPPPPPLPRKRLRDYIMPRGKLKYLFCALSIVMVLLSVRDKNYYMAFVACVCLVASVRRDY